MYRASSVRRDRWIDVGGGAVSWSWTSEPERGRPATDAPARQQFYSSTTVPPHLVKGITRRRFHPHRRGIPRPRVVFRDVVRTSSALSDDDRRPATTDRRRLARGSSRNNGDHPIPKSQITIITKTQIAIDRTVDSHSVQCLCGA